MLTLFLMLCFAVMSLVFLILAVSGHRGSAQEGPLGRGVPQAVRRDPALLAHAHRLIAFWCTGAAALAAAPLVPLYLMAVDPDSSGPETLSLLVLAGYAVLVSSLGHLPFERVKRLG